jgi:NAD(P)-dependent dehydrogenase (short-subunit alcohol dehydrogenase family)
MSAGRSPHATKLGFKDLTGRVAIITGSSRGIGRECALSLAREGCSIVVAAKSTEEVEKLPGTIYSVAAEVEALGAKALPFKLDVRDASSCEACVAKTVEVFGRVDVLINNASALWWQDIVDTPMAKYDLITTLNTRGSFALARSCLPHMKKNGFGRVISMSPPIRPEYQAYKGFTAYHISKFGMTMVAMGCAAEGARDGITGFSLWPATVIESQASINFELGDTSMWRKASIIADATVALVCEDADFTGHQCIDDEYLAYKGLTESDLAHYRYNPEVEPPRALAQQAREHGDKTMDWGGFKRGDVRKLKEDQAKLTTSQSKL